MAIWYRDEPIVEPDGRSHEELRKEIERLEMKKYGRLISCWPEDEGKEMYLVARDKIRKFDEKPKCIAWKTIGGKHTAELVRDLNRETIPKGIHILVVSDFCVYGKYRPDEIVETEIKFLRRVRRMTNPKK